MRITAWPWLLIAAFVTTATTIVLPIAQQLCELMGGGITAQFVPGKGSAFTVRVPARMQDRTGSAASESASGADLVSV